MDLEISIEEGEFSLESSPIYYVFLIYDVVQKRVLSLRISKSRSSHVDRLRSLHSSIKKTNPNLQENETFFIGNINYVFFNSCNKFSKNNSKKIQTNQPLIIPLLLKFIRKKKEIKSKIILFLFNKFLLGEKNAKIIKIEENEKELFFKIDFYQEEQLLNLELETIFYKRKKAKYSKILKYLETQQELLKINLDSTKVNQLLALFRLQSLKFLKIRNIHGLNLANHSIILPNDFEIEIIFLNAGSSVTKKPEYFCALFKLSYFCLYYLGFSVDDIFFIKKQDLQKIITEDYVEFNLNKKVLTRTILDDTRARFGLLKDEIYTLFDSSERLVLTKKTKHLALRSFSFNLNRDLKGIKLFSEKVFKIESLKMAAIFRLLSLTNNSLVSKEFEISEKFLERISKTYVMRQPR